MNIGTLLNALPGACAQGLIWGIMAIGVYITYRILDLADLTVDGTMCTGGAVVHYADAERTFRCDCLCSAPSWQEWQAGLATGVFHTVNGHSGNLWQEF